MSDHPRFKPWLRPVARRYGGVQFGIAPGGMILEGLTAHEVGLLARLDGTLSRRASFEHALGAGVSTRRWRELLDVVEGLDLLEDPAAGPAHSSRIPGHVLVDGTGELARECASLLRRCGVERVSQGRNAVDVVLAAPHLTTPHLPRPDLVIVVAEQVLDPRRGEGWRRHRVPHLPVIPGGPRAQVGPLVGTSALAPCLWCLDLHRTDRDDEWPTVMAQLCGSDEPRITERPATEELPPGMGHLVSGVVALYAVGLLAGQPPPEGVSAELTLPWPRLDHRRWTRHPRCDRHVLGRSVVA
jgi:hypothetical protein